MITKRIKEYIDYKELTISSVESAIGASNGMLRKAFTKNTDIKSQWLEKLLESFLDLNPVWLTTGKGGMIKPKHQNKEVEKNHLKNHHANTIEPNKQENEVVLNSNKIVTNQNKEKSYPLVNKANLVEEVESLYSKEAKNNVILLNAHAAASDFSQALTNPVHIKEFETICLPPFMHRRGTFFAVPVTGDSMHPTITHKDIVAGSLKQTQDFVSGLPYVFYHEDEGLMVKRFHWNRREHNELSLTSDNEYMDEFITTIDKISPYIIKVEYKMSDNLRNWNSDIRSDIRELKQSIKRLERK